MFINQPRTARRLCSHVDTKRLTNDRPPSFTAKHVLYDDHGILFTDNTQLHARRRKAFHGALKFYDDRVGRLEDAILENVEDIVVEMKRKDAVDITSVCRDMFIRVIHILLVGEGVYSPEHFTAVETFFRRWTSFTNADLAILQCLPVLRHVPGLRFKKKMDDLISARDDVIKLYFEDIKQTYDEMDERGIVDHLLAVQKAFRERGDLQTITDETIKAFIIESFVGSVDNNVAVISVIFLVLLHRKDIQDKMFLEISNTVPLEDPVSLQHKSSLPYAEAVILESMRFGSSSTLLVPHYTHSDIDFDGHHIPRNSILFMNAWFCHRRADLWAGEASAWEFHPERFLAEDGRLLPSNHEVRLNMLPFGTGPRQCPAEVFAKNRLFLIVTNLVKHFQLSPVGKTPLPDMDPRSWPDDTIVIKPDIFTCGLRLRQS